MFASLFAGLDRAYVKVTLTNEYEDRGDKGRKRIAKTVWVEQRVDEKVFEDHLMGKQGIAIAPVTDRNTCIFGVIDIDEYVDWSESRLTNLCNRIEQLQLPLIPGRSKSGGVRLYLFCEEMSADIVRIYLHTCASLLSFPKAEVFPKAGNIVKERGDKGFSIALPYFNGNETECAGFWKTERIPLEEFIKLALSKLCKKEKLQSAGTVQLSNSADFSDGPPCLQGLAVNGFPEGSRNFALFNMGVYLRLKFGDDIERPLEEFNSKLLSPPLSFKEFGQVLKSLRKKTYHYTCKREPICNACNKELCLTRQFGVGSTESVNNIVIGDIIKMSTEPPIWYITVNGQRLLVETEDFIDLRRFTRLCVEKLHLIPTLSLPKLKKQIQISLDNLKIEEAPDNASITGQCLELFQQYLLSKPPGQTKEQVVFGCPWYEKGYVLFRGKDFTDYLDMQKFRQLDSRRVWAILREYNVSLGGEYSEQTVRVNDRVIKVRAVKAEKPVFLIDNEQEDF